MGRAGIRRWVALAAGVLTVAAGLGSQTSATADPAAELTALVPAEQLAAEVRFRKELALDHRLEHVRAVHSSAGAVEQDGVRFSAAEARELQQRVAAGDEINAVAQRYLSDHRAEAYAGTYLDHAAGGLMTVLVTRDQAAHRTELTRRIVHSDRLRVRAARYSLAALERAQGRITAADAALRRAGHQVTYTAIDVRRNRLTVALPQASDAARAALGRLAPLGMLDVVGAQVDLAVCADSLHCATESPPLDGGTDIESYDAYPGAVAFCTLGFVGHKGSSTQSYVLSAGHCGPSTSVWLQQLTPIGYVSQNTFKGTTLSDALVIPIPAALGRGYVKMRANPPAFRPVIGREKTSDDYVGKPTCAYGIRSLLRCGTITTKTAIVRLATDTKGVYVTLKYQRIASHYCGPGDSGAPNYHRGRAQGITSFSVRYSSTKIHCGYSHIGNVMSATGITSVTSR